MNITDIPVQYFSAGILVVNIMQLVVAVFALRLAAKSRKNK
jgi:hypothetical protein